ncbi:IS91 family transposase [Candidatus Dependentiae bacterium]|nr:IS91 family transposase [Candidatus Dependentiae bacterium]
MCSTNNSSKESAWLKDKKYRLADFFDAHWDNYKKSPAAQIQPEQYKAVNAIRVCRTEALGKDVYACPECGEITEVYHSCKNRFCPTCSWQDTLVWADKVKDKMLNLPHRHAIFTLPHQLIPLIKKNRKELLSVLMRTSADTLKDWMWHKHGIKCGIISVLHTYGEKKENHMHTHMIVSWGGIKPSTGEMIGIKGDYVNFKFLKNKFRKKFEDALVELYDTGELEHEFANRIVFMRYLKRINAKHWIIHLEPSITNPDRVIRYIGRYSKRACLSEYKITCIEGEYISFRYKNYKRKDVNNKPIEEEITLHYRKFFPRLLQHVPLPYFRIVRYYGVYSNRASIPTEYLYTGQNSVEKQNIETWESLQIENRGENPLICTHCEQRKVYQYTIIRKKQEDKANIFERSVIKEFERQKANAA